MCAGRTRSMRIIGSFTCAGMNSFGLQASPSAGVALPNVIRKKKPRSRAVRVAVDYERRIVVVGQMEIDFTMLAEMANPNKRLLWAFVWNDDKTRIQAVPFNE